jgi:hypothetical protein
VAVVVSLLFEDGQVEFVDGFRLDTRVALVQVIDQHAPALESQHALVALVDEALVVRR